MRSFLYLTPRFAPAATVGALRAVKFSRHLPAQGWRPVVLCDFEPARGFDPSLESRLPSELVVEVNWSAESAAALAAARGGRCAPAAVDGRSGLRRSVASLLRERAPWVIDGTRAVLHEAKVPITRAEFGRIRHAVAVARSLVARERCEAIVASGPPWEALLVGALVARLERLPLVLDFRDPWALCELGRQERSWMEQQRALLLERWCIAQAEALLLNTDAARDDYSQVYGGRAGLRIETLRNHAEAWEGGPEVERSGPFRMVFAGRLRDRVMSHGLLRALAALRADGWGPERLVLEVAGPLSNRVDEAFRAAGVRDQLVVREWMPHVAVPSWLGQGDLLVVLNAPTQQRIPAKFYECIMHRRPLLVCGSTPELAEMTAGMAGVALCDRDDDAAISEAIRDALARGGAPVQRNSQPFTSEAATAKLAALLAAVAESPRVAHRPSAR